MLIAIAIAEEIQGLQRIALVPEPSGGPPWAPHEPIFFEDFLRLRHMGHAQGVPLGSAKVKENSEAQKFQNFNATFCNPWIFSAMAMSMSIYRTLCVLVFPENFTPRDVPS